MTINTYTKGQIDRLGVTIRLEGKIQSEKTLKDLQDYRTSYKDSLSEIFKILCELSQGVRKEAIVTYRIKRIDSIVNKLMRKPEMRFSRMWDVAGCRCILKNDSQVEKLKNKIKEKLEIVKENDYITEPKEDGYKSLHLYVRQPNCESTIEIQIRNQRDHNWATLVEITDLLFDTKLKEYGNNRNLLRFHFLLSNYAVLSISERKELAKILKKYNYFDKLSEVFTRNYLLVRKQWYDIEIKQQHNYFLIESNKNEVPKIDSFSNYAEAENKYFSIYKDRQNANIVLTHVLTPNYNTISTAYSNYILTYHSFMDESISIIQNLIVEALRRRKVYSFIMSLNLYFGLVVNHIKNLKSEISYTNELNFQQTRIKGKKKARDIKALSKEKEWINDIKDQIYKNKERAQKLIKSIKNNLPQSPFERLLIRLTIQILYKRNFKKLK